MGPVKDRLLATFLIWSLTAGTALDAALGALILGEVLGPAFLGGAALIAVGVLGIAAATRERREAPE